MNVQVLGPGCTKCQKLFANTQTALQELGVDGSVEKVSDMQQILTYNVMTTPVLVVDGQVKLAGRVASVAEIKALLR